MIQPETRSYPKALAVAFGRVFYGSQGRVYFSQVIIDDFSHIGKCFQRNDPIAEDASDILDTDGGEILIQDAGDIKALEPFKAGVLVFCDNGVWYISGTTDAGFSATSYAVSKISPFVLYSKRTIVPMRDVILFAGREGCYVVQEEALGQATVSSLTERTIQSYWKTFILPETHAVYDELLGRVHFVNPGTAGSVLIFDAKLSSWHPWDLNVGGGASAKSAVGAVYNDATGTTMYVHQADSRIEFAKQSVDSLLDFGVGEYKSFIQTQPETVQNFSQKKGVPLINVMLRRTETQIVGYNEGYTFDKPSSCVVSLKFDWDDGKVSAPREGYKALPTGYTATSIPEQIRLKNEIVTFKDKIRGVGRAVQARFESTGSNRLDLYGYSIQYSIKGRM
jgi:hypothetical protein